MDLDAGHQRRRPAARHRRHRSRCALLVAARRPPARATVALPAASARRAVEPRRPSGHGGVRQQAGDLGRAHSPLGAQCQERRRHRHGPLLARRRLLAVANPNGAQVWSTEDWTPVTRVFAGHAGPIYWVTISRDNRTLATSSWDGTVRLWDIKSEQAIGAPLPGLPGHGVAGLLTPDGNAVIAGYDTGLAYRWDIRPHPSHARHARSPAARSRARSGTSSYPAATIRPLARTETPRGGNTERDLGSPARRRVFSFFARCTAFRSDRRATLRP